MAVNGVSKTDFGTDDFQPLFSTIAAEAYLSDSR
jgi:hypothetical protein